MSMDTFDVANARRTSKERGDSSLTWNILTVVMLVLMLCVAAVFLVIFFNPSVGINPFPPPTMPVIPTLPPLPTATNTPRFQMQPSWTPTLVVEMPPTATESGEGPGPDATMIPPATPLPGDFSFVVPLDSVYAVPGQSFHPDAGCNWLGVAGQATNLSGAPVLNLLVQLGGVFEGRTYETKTMMTGTATQYGQGGFEFTISDRPVASNDALWLQLLDQQFLPLSDKVYFDTYTDCEKNLVIVYFRQIR